MNLLLNLLWLTLGGGFFMSLGWLLAAGLMAISIIGLPWTPAAFRLGLYTLLPFGSTVIEAEADDVTLLGNIVWFVFAGWWLALAHIGCAFALALTIIGLPFAWAHLKLALLSLAPVGKIIIPNP